MTTTIEFEQLADIARHPVWDGNLISKEARDSLVKAGLIGRAREGWNFATATGIEYAITLGILKS